MTVCPMGVLSFQSVATRVSANFDEGELMFSFKDPKTQEKEIRSPDGLPPGVIVSPDTRRSQRVPPGQSRTLKWPVLDASGPPEISLERWKFSISGRVARPVEWNWEEFQKLPRVKVFSDFHCVTRWSRLGNLWEGSRYARLNRAGRRRAARCAFCAGLWL